MRIVRLQYRVDIIVIRDSDAAAVGEEFMYTTNTRQSAQWIVDQWERNVRGAVATITEEEVP